MTRISAYVFRGAGTATLVLSVVAVGAACGVDVVLRAYLGKSLWRPGREYLTDVLKDLPSENPAHSPYAGMATDGVSPSLQAARDAYRGLFPGEPSADVRQKLTWPASEIA